MAANFAQNQLNKLKADLKQVQNQISDLSARVPVLQSQIANLELLVAERTAKDETVPAPQPPAVPQPSAQPAAA